jgi:hypothetical protein
VDETARARVGGHSRQPYDSDASTHFSGGESTMSPKDIRRPATLTRVLSRTAKRRTLARELADFTSAADRLELETLIEAQSADDTREVRGILARQAA